MTVSRVRVAAALSVAVAAAVIAALAVTDVFGAAKLPTASGPRPAGPPPARFEPAHGAYFGAWVKPVVDSQPGRIAAVNALQRRIGRPLDIIHDYVRWQAPFPTESDLGFVRQGSILLLSWAGADTRAIESGKYDSWIRQRALAIKAVGWPLFLEWRWEMDRPNLRTQVHSPADYIAAWKHIRSIFTQEQVSNVAWVWCPTANGFSSGYAGSYYPGDSQVDWICADAYPGPGVYRPFGQIVRPFLKWASHRPKPIMIGEYGVPHSYEPQQQARWLRGAGRIVLGNPQIKALVYFDADSADSVPAASFGVEDNAAALYAFRGIADTSYFNPRHLKVAEQ